jgi:hypothetical protein
MKWVGDEYFDVDVEYDVIDGDDSVGLDTDYEFTVTFINEHGLPEDFTQNLTDAEKAEIIEAIEEDLNNMENDYVD